MTDKWTDDELIALGSDYGCMTGDCPHTTSSGCLGDLIIYAGEQIDLAKRLRRDFKQMRVKFAETVSAAVDAGIRKTLAERDEAAAEIERLRAELADARKCVIAWTEKSLKAIAELNHIYCIVRVDWNENESHTDCGCAACGELIHKAWGSPWLEEATDE